MMDMTKDIFFLLIISGQAMFLLFKDVPGGIPKSDLLGVTVALMEGRVK